MTDQTATILTTLRQRAAAGYLWLGLVADELERLQQQNNSLEDFAKSQVEKVMHLQHFNKSLADRVVAQSELLARRAEKNSCQLSETVSCQQK